MSWLNPDKISSSGYNPQKLVEVFTVEYGEIGRKILGCFDDVDPLHVFMGENVDEYIGYAKRFMEKLGKRDPKTLESKQISELVRDSFSSEQIGKFVSEADLDLLADKIVTTISN